MMAVQSDMTRRNVGWQQECYNYSAISETDMNLFNASLPYSYKEPFSMSMSITQPLRLSGPSSTVLFGG